MKRVREIKSPVLYIFSGLPGTGKTTLAKILSEYTGACYIRIDSIEQELRKVIPKLTKQGYQVAFKLAADNLKLGNHVVADSCNPIQETRTAWEKTASSNHARFVNIEVICSSVTEHRRRIETRTTDIPGLKLPVWADVENREYHRWSTDRIIIDTADRTVEQSFNKIIRELRLD